MPISTAAHIVHLVYSTPVQLYSVSGSSLSKVMKVKVMKVKVMNGKVMKVKVMKGKVMKGKVMKGKVMKQMSHAGNEAERPSCWLQVGHCNPNWCHGQHHSRVYFQADGLASRDLSGWCQHQ